ncbi:MAG: C4-dicarboxylate TRAP transporter substrate-binding protein [Spirochaetaceae bacterium]|jgi:TRAP-type C4-dicarboxylate transport system substrate-binding protein|nr:C4-dicarboxylate TRAP transporter substrate-binding protein [Spirochaetaceae bacterium]
MKKTKIILIAALAVTALLAGCKKKEEKYILKMSTQLAPDSIMVQGFNLWAEAVKEKTEGALTIEVYPSAQLGSDEDVIEQAIQGANVAVLTDGGRMANYVKDIGIIGMPYIADNYAELRKITETSVFDGWINQLASQDGIRMLSANWYDGPRHFLTNVQVNVPADLKGQRIRTPGAPVWAKSVAAMGATPIAMGWNDSYNAIQSKAIDGVEAQNTASYSLHLYELLKYIDKTGHFQLANFIIVGEKWFTTLPEHLQKILVDECKAAAYENAAQIEKTADELEKDMVVKGMTVINSDRSAFKAAAEAAYTELGFIQLRDQIWREIGKR